MGQPAHEVADRDGGPPWRRGSPRPCGSLFRRRRCLKEARIWHARRPCGQSRRSWAPAHLDGREGVGLAQFRPAPPSPVQARRRKSPPSPCAAGRDRRSSPGAGSSRDRPSRPRAPIRGRIRASASSRGVSRFRAVIGIGAEFVLGGGCGHRPASGPRGSPSSAHPPHARDIFRDPPRKPSRPSWCARHQPRRDLAHRVQAVRAGTPDAAAPKVPRPRGLLPPGRGAAAGAISGRRARPPWTR